MEVFHIEYRFKPGKANRLQIGKGCRPQCDVMVHSPLSFKMSRRLDGSILFEGVKIAYRHVSQGPPPKGATGGLLNKSAENSSCVFVVRGINRLGWEASSLLHAYFSNYGDVSSIRLACTSRTDEYLPPSVAFVVMANSESVEAVLLAAGAVSSNGYLIIAGQRILIQSYNQPKSSNEDDCPDTVTSVVNTLDL